MTMAQPDILVEVDINEKLQPIQKKAFFCTLCDYSTDYRSNLTVHQVNIHNKRTGTLECCDILFSDKEAYQQHVTKFHPRRYRCKICDQRFFNSSKLRQHEKSCAKVKNFTCNICDYTTLSRKALQEHNLKVHQTERNPDLKPSSSSLKIPFKIKLHKCTDCSFKTKWPNSFKRHMDSGHKIIYNCCDSRFSSKKLLYQHKLAFHAKKFSCSNCAKKFSSLLLLQRHQITHFDQQTFKCNFCDYVSLWNSTLNSHIAKKHPDISTSSLLEGQPDQRSHLPVNDDVSDECGSSTENKAASDVSSVRLLQTPRKQEADKKAEFNNEDKLATASRKQYSRKRKSANSIYGKENLDLSEICDASKNDGGVVVEEQLKIRRKSPRKKQMDAKCPSTSKADSSIPSLLDRSPSLTDRHSIESASRNDSNCEIVDNSNRLLLLDSDSDEEANHSVLQTSSVMNESQPLQADLKGEEGNSPKKATIYSCTQCQHTTIWRTSLKRHMKVHESEKINSTPTKLLLTPAPQPKLSSKSVQGTMMSCFLCPYTTKWPGNLQSHVAKIHGVKKFKCSVCPQEFNSPYILRYHQAVHSENDLFRCSICEFTTSRKGYLKIHVAKKHKRKDQHSLTLPMDRDPMESSILKNSVGQLQPALNWVVDNLPLNQTENEISLNGESYVDRSILESGHSFSPQSIPLPPSAVRRSGRLGIEQAASSKNASNCQLFPPGSKMAISPIHDEARQLRAQISLAMTVSAVLPLLQRLLEMSCYLTNLIRESTEADFRCHSIESFEYVWNTTKIAVVRWEDLKGLTNQDTSLNAVRYAYGTLPLFSNWEKLDHLEMLGNVILLIINTVKNSQSLSPNNSEFRFLNTNLSFQRTTNASCRSSNNESTSTNQVEKRNVASVAEGILTKAANVSAVDPSKENNVANLKEFCRLANIAMWQNTKCRTRNGCRDDNGDYHSMYRYGIGKILGLYCPADVTHLKCCGKVFDLREMKTHVIQYHKTGQPGRTKPSISPA
ncbi:zinc finger protein 236-like isoform X1 [Daphnia pulex]|uniref:zinc finger protein 236-like isoform X1 n=2 Tax=Daphnia pulex TaxID=6669 RepID=UPI001EE115D9|nr:zinc finger protein 236-like isoform X1 [Daphnia pulex]XP_046445378.1 zinc finger protein 236-like isoform X1 [Daphnia pulex]XP_046445381.1 zinc finger protein 236-like isoform X1 [Daphnia pulex]